MYSLSELETLWPIAALLVFLTIFVAALVWAIRVDKKQIHKWENIPFESGETKSGESL